MVVFRGKNAGDKFSKGPSKAISVIWILYSDVFYTEINSGVKEPPPHPPVQKIVYPLSPVRGTETPDPVDRILYAGGHT